MHPTVRRSLRAAASPTFRGTGYQSRLARSLDNYADPLRGRDKPGDWQKSVALLEESLAISSELGMKPLMERVLARKKILGA